jgi:hypothetical protein
MLVMMKHPVHGRLPVYSVYEVESNKAAGWVVDNDAPEMKTAPPPAPEILEPAPTPEPPKSALKSFLAGLSEDEV